MEEYYDFVSIGCFLRLESFIVIEEVDEKIS